MFLVYYLSMVTVGSAATDWMNDGVFGDGWHLFGIGSAKYEEAAENYGDSDQIIDAFIAEYGTDEMKDTVDIGAMNIMNLPQRTLSLLLLQRLPITQT